jgi:hypothetical protein
MCNTLLKFVYFNEDLSLHYYRNINNPYPLITDNIKDKKFTLLSRTKKKWRSDFIYSIWNDGLHNEGFVSHGSLDILSEEEEEDIGFGITRSIDFDNTILTADTLDVNQHNDHSNIVYEHFTNSYFNIVLETFIDCENTGGVFITEKTWKPIRNGQMFIIVGCFGSLRHLKDLGFKTFDGILDESYDREFDVRKRWRMCLELTKKIARMSISELHELYLKAIPILEHNQRHFQTIQKSRIEKLVTDLDTIS